MIGWSNSEACVTSDSIYHDISLLYLALKPIPQTLSPWNWVALTYYDDRGHYILKGFPEFGCPIADMCFASLGALTPQT